MKTNGMIYSQNSKYTRLNISILKIYQHIITFLSFLIINHYLRLFLDINKPQNQYTSSLMFYSIPTIKRISNILMFLKGRNLLKQFFINSDLFIQLCNILYNLYNVNYILYGIKYTSIIKYAFLPNVQSVLIFII